MRSNRKNKHTVRILSLLGAAAASAALSVGTLFGSLPVMAAGSLEMSTDYPGVYAKPGAQVSFSLDFTNSGSGESVNLSAAGLPDGWDGTFEGNGNQISSVYAKTGENDDLATYNVTVPDDAKKGDYNVTLKGDGSSLGITIHVTDEDTGNSNLSTDYDNQQGTAGTAFTFNATVQNSTSGEQSYALSASDLPAGWTVAFKPAGSNSNASSVGVDAHGSAQVTVTITSPDDAAAGDYKIPIAAVSGSQNLTADLTCTITGNYDTQVTTSDGTLSFTAAANHRKAVSVNITNNGNLDLSNVNLTATAPSDWNVEFSESTIDTLAAGQTKTVTMYVTPAGNAISGDYTMDLKAANDENSVTSTFRVTVKTGTAWGVAGICIIAAVILGLIGIFHKFGRH